MRKLVESPYRYLTQSNQELSRNISQQECRHKKSLYSSQYLLFARNYDKGWENTRAYDNTHISSETILHNSLITIGLAAYLGHDLLHE